MTSNELPSSSRRDVIKHALLLSAVPATSALAAPSNGVIVLAQLDFHPDDMEQVTALAKRMMAETQQEDGCLHYAFAVDVSTANRLQLSELWRDDAALATHLDAPTMREFRVALRGVRFLKSTVKRYTQTDVADLVLPPLPR